MIGDIVRDDGEVYEVVWSGGEGLIPDRETKPSIFWTSPKRIYNKKSDYWTTPRETERKELDKSTETSDNPSLEES